MKNLFGLTLRNAHVAPHETWDPKHVKKMELVDNSSYENTIVANIYLFLRSRKAAARQSAQLVHGSGSVPSFVICLDLSDNLMQLEATLTHEQLRSLFRQLGEGLCFAFAQQQQIPLVLSANNDLLRQVAGFLFERFTYEQAFVKSFAGATTSLPEKKAIPDVYLNEYMIEPQIYPLLALNKIAHSLIDFELNGSHPLKEKPSKLVSTVESRTTPNGIIPDITQLKQFGDGTSFLEMFARIVASQLYANWFPSGINAAAGSKLRNGLLGQGNIAVQQVLRAATGTTQPDVSHFVKHATANIKH